jgi:hypothetical protein
MNIFLLRMSFMKMTVKRRWPGFQYAHYYPAHYYPARIIAHRNAQFKSSNYWK